MLIYIKDYNDEENDIYYNFDEGDINSDEWPKRFFEDALSESLALASAQHERSKKDAS